MNEPNSTQIRNIVLLSHTGAGKTMLAESMLNAAGVSTRMGSVEDGTTVSDYEPEESKRGSSIQLSVLRCPWKSNQFNLLDTPGYADFRGEVISGVRVADSALIVVSAPSSVEVGTQQMWKIADQNDLPKIVYVSKMDRENADFQKVVDDLTERFGRQCVPLTIPIGSEDNFSGVIDLLDSKAQIPDGLESSVESFRELLTEAIAEADDDLATKYLEGDTLTDAELKKGLKSGIAAGNIVPILSGDSQSKNGIDELMNALAEYMPSGESVIVASDKSGESVELKGDSKSKLAALVFKTTADPFVGKLSYFRVYSGTLRSDSQIWNSNTEESERIGQIFHITGKTQEPATSLSAGDIGAVPKLNSVLTGHSICEKESEITIDGFEFPSPVYNRAVYPKSKADVDKMTTSLARIVEEDPSIALEREPNTLEMLMGGLGDTHIDITVEKIKRKFGVELELALPKVPYMETISKSATVEYKHKKQSGGHGQYGHVYLSLEPLSRGSEFEFASAVVGGSVPKEYIPSVEKGVNKALSEGSVAGFPIVDMKATLVDGSFHPVDSSGMSFEIAGMHAIGRGVLEAGPILLEPIMHITVSVPDEYTGEIAGDLNGKRAKIQSMAPQGDGTTVIEGTVPQSEVLTYSTTLRSQTQGIGSFTTAFDHYEEVPAHLVDKLVQAIKSLEE
ncbi:MAG: elongation factor G [Chloroflexota bacterium]|nr:elongation factor G [Chloroflexota bacterium]